MQVSVVDDEVRMVELVTSYLEEAGFTSDRSGLEPDAARADRDG